MFCDASVGLSVWMEQSWKAATCSGVEQSTGGNVVITGLHLVVYGHINETIADTSAHRCKKRFFIFFFSFANVLFIFRTTII